VGLQSAVVANTLSGEPIHSGRGDASAKSTELAEAAVINEDEEDVRRTFGGLDGFWKLRRVRVEISAADLAGKMEVGARQDVGCAGSGGLRSCGRLHVRFRHCAYLM
jgi:hypothetical protein